jgi:hypothetical protein
VLFEALPPDPKRPVLFEALPPDPPDPNGDVEVDGTPEPPLPTASDPEMLPAFTEPALPGPLPPEPLAPRPLPPAEPRPAEPALPDRALDAEAVELPLLAKLDPEALFDAAETWDE